jgi:succinate dehydrogenase flavin-adding protein (antitoxin of CptAB toxin-antitoxin module)
MLELDLLLNDYLSQHFEQLDQEQLALFKTLLDYPDPVLLDMLLGNIQATDTKLAEFIATIQIVSRPQ